MIAGFDMEYNQLSSDGTVYDNGYGICFIPRTQVTAAAWNSSNIPTCYMSSTMHTTHLPGIVTKFQEVLGSHLIKRNVLLSNSVNNSNYQSYACTWTTAYATLMSIGQMTGNFAANWNQYDDGEAYYKLPIFDFTNFKTDSPFWTRGVWGYYGSIYNAWIVYIDGSVNRGGFRNELGVRPLIYLR